MKNTSKKHLKKKKKLSIKRQNGGTNIAPFNAEYILEFMSDTSQVQDLVIDPSLDFLLQIAETETGIKHFEQPFDLLLIGSWNGISNDNSFSFLSLVSIIILLSGLYSIYKFNSIHIIKTIKSKLYVDKEKEYEDSIQEENKLLNQLSSLSDQETELQNLDSIEKSQQSSSSNGLFYNIVLSLAIIILGPSILFSTQICNNKPSSFLDPKKHGKSGTSEFLYMFKESLNFYKECFYNPFFEVEGKDESVGMSVSSEGRGTKRQRAEGVWLGGTRIKSTKLIGHNKFSSKKYNRLSNNNSVLIKGGFEIRPIYNPLKKMVEKVTSYLRTLDWTSYKGYITYYLSFSICCILLIVAFITALVWKILYSLLENGGNIFAGVGGLILVLAGLAKEMFLQGIETDTFKEHSGNHIRSLQDKLMPTVEYITSDVSNQAQKFYDQLTKEEQDELENLDPSQYEDKLKQIRGKKEYLRSKLIDMQKKKEKLSSKKSGLRIFSGGMFSKLKDKLSYFVAYNGNVIAPDMIRTLYQDKDIFYLNGELYNMFSLNFLKSQKKINLNVNRHCLPFVQRISKITSIYFKEFNTNRIINKCRYNRQLKELQDNYGNVISSCILCINNNLEIPISITPRGIFLSGRSYCQTVEGEDLQKPHSDFINQISIEYNNLTTLIPVNYISNQELNQQQVIISDRLYKRNRNFDQLKDNANRGINFLKKFTKS